MEIDGDAGHALRGSRGFKHVRVKFRVLTHAEKKEGENERREEEDYQQETAKHAEENSHEPGLPIHTTQREEKLHKKSSETKNNQDGKQSGDEDLETGCSRFQVRDAQGGNDAHHIIEIGFSWSNDSTHEGRGVVDFIKGAQDQKTKLTRYTFTSSYANAKPMKARLAKHGAKVIKVLKQLIEPTDGNNSIVLDVCPFDRGVAKAPKKKDSKQEETAAVHFDPDPNFLAMEVLPPGGSGYLLETMFNLQYNFFRHKHGEMEIIAGNMPPTSVMMAQQPPRPMTSMLLPHTYTFTNFEEAATQLAWHAEQFQKQAIALKLFNSVRHSCCSKLGKSWWSLYSLASSHPPRRPGQ
ncbi:hypothetical protein M409DRAFT_56442 [Zasmidium cellare ATCC 36951]|uniref:Uncharacterized protein n=1 Tax=Zasmidium cellare ATCC 36951 TaxID=1080233 RepID=A0A6A6CBS0_ZASCE|nr:uncharacterized protein M409DRAFT_56442 [Zasmidium cellare ATCC 36951]KAF2164614.1 hypothetical protein M409DRAFT_56442 [Zasmidium cellare ATCC 36951]